MKTNQYAEFVDKFLNKFIEILAPITKLEYLLAVVIFLLLWTFLLTLRLKRIANNKNEGFDRVIGLNDRVAKLQLQVSDVKSESKNNFDTINAGIKALQIEIESLRQNLPQLSLESNQREKVALAQNNQEQNNFEKDKQIDNEKKRGNSYCFWLIIACVVFVGSHIPFIKLNKIKI